jgi:HEAT repeat protein
MKRGIVLLALLLLGCGQKSTDYWVAEAKAPNSAERLHAIHALRNKAKEAERVVPVLTTALNDPDAFVRRDAARALGDFGPEAAPAVPALLALHKDRDPVRRAAAEALEKIDSEAAARFPRKMAKK